MHQKPNKTNNLTIYTHQTRWTGNRCTEKANVRLTSSMSPHGEQDHTFGSSAHTFFRSFSSFRRLQPRLKYLSGLFALCCNLKHTVTILLQFVKKEL